MGISMSGGPYSYNRFDEYQALLSEKKAAKDYDGDGKIESGSKEHAGSVHNAIQRATGGKPDGKDTRKEGFDQMSMYAYALSRLSGMYHPLDEKKDEEPEDERKEAADRGAEEKRQKKEGKYGEAKETEELEKEEDKKDKEEAKEAFMAGYAAALSEAKGAGSPAKMAAAVKDEAKDNKKETESMAFASKKQRRSQAVNAAEEFVMQHLIDEGLATNAVSAETMMLHMSDAWYDAILAEMGPAHPIETEQQAEAQKDRRAGKQNREGNKTAKNPGTQKGEGYNTTN